MNLFLWDKYKQIIKSAIAILLLLLSLSCKIPESSPEKKSIDVFILAGQSNMLGYKGDATKYPKDPYKIDQRILFYWVTPKVSSSDNKWTQMQPQGGKYQAGRFGPEVTFSRSLVENGYNPAIFKFSCMGTSLVKDWRIRGENGLYDKMIAEYHKAISILEKQGKTINVRAFIWIQGESDAQNELAKSYFRRLSILIKDIRENVVGNPYLPIILGVDEQHPKVKIHPEIVEAQKRFAKSDSNTIFVSMFELEKADLTHLTPAGLEVHGIRLFEAFNALKTMSNEHL